MSNVIDPFTHSPEAAAGPAARLFQITPHNSNSLPFVTTGLYIGGAGDVTVRDRGTNVAVTFKAVVAGTILPIRTARVMATGTTATDIVGLA